MIQDDVNQHILRLLEDMFSLGAAHITIFTPLWMWTHTLVVAKIPNIQHEIFRDVGVCMHENVINQL